MKKFVCILIILSILILPACGDDKVIKGKLYTTYGIVNEEEVKDCNVKYDIIWGNVVWSVLLFETIIAPIYFIGFSIKEPVCMKNTREF